MQPEQIAITITRQGTRVIARTSGPPGQRDPTARDAAPPPAATDARRGPPGVPLRNRSGPLEPFNAADAVLHRFGFVAEVDHRGGFHRLPAGMIDPAEQRATVTRAVDALRVEGFACAVEADLVDNSLSVRTAYETSLGDQLAHLAASISRAGHTREAVAALSELTAPGDGVLDQLTDVLDATADWWERLGAEADPLYADNLRRINQHIGVARLEVQRLRNSLADRHTDHPLHARPDRTVTQGPKVAAALARSPAARRTPPAPTPSAPASSGPPPAARLPPTPGH